MKFKALLKYNIVFAFSAALLVFTNVATGEQEKSAVKNPYKDPKGYYAAILPEGWKIQEYPQETIRSKIALNHPSEEGVIIRIIVGPGAQNTETTEHLYKEVELKASNMRQQFPGASSEVKNERLGEHEAVLMHLKIPNVGEQDIFMVTAKGIRYSIAYSANTSASFAKNYDTFKRFLSEFVILETGKAFTQDDLKKSLVASKIRLVQLMEQQGMIKAALQYVYEGLAIDPDNKELKEKEEKLKAQKK